MDNANNGADAAAGGTPLFQIGSVVSVPESGAGGAGREKGVGVVVDEREGHVLVHYTPSSCAPCYAPWMYRWVEGSLLSETVSPPPQPIAAGANETDANGRLPTKNAGKGTLNITTAKVINFDLNSIHQL